MNVVRKTATITPTGSETDFPGTFEVVLSAPTQDRDGDTLLPEEWKTPLPEHITFDIDHGMSVATTVGSGSPAIDAKTGNLVVRGTYSSLDRAQEVRTLVNEGHIRTTSVAFMNLPATVKNGKKISQRELLNGAFVAVPSNREAVIMNSKGVDLKYSPDQERDENGRFASGGGAGGSISPARQQELFGYVDDARSVFHATDGIANNLPAHPDRDSVIIAEVNASNRINSASTAISEGRIEEAHGNLVEAAGFMTQAAEAAEKVVPNSTESAIMWEASFGMERLASNFAKETQKSLDDYSTKSSSDSSNIDDDASEEAKSAEEVLKAAANIAAAIEADSAEDADSVTVKAQAMNIIVEALTSEN